MSVPVSSASDNLPELYLSVTGGQRISVQLWLAGDQKAPAVIVPFLDFDSNTTHSNTISLAG